MYIGMDGTNNQMRTIFKKFKLRKISAKGFCRLLAVDCATNLLLNPYHHLILQQNLNRYNDGTTIKVTSIWQPSAYLVL